MTHTTPPGTVTPVRAAIFPTGPDVVLLNPDITYAQWRAERLRAGVRPRIVLIGLAGAVLAVSAALSSSGSAALLVLGAGVVAVAASAYAGWCSGARLIIDHRHAPGRPCRMDRRRGEYFFRSRDFADLGPAGAAVRSLIVGVHEVHRSPACAWIDPAVPREVHQVVWQALCCLERTRAARTLATDLAADPDSATGELAAAAHEAVTTIDTALDEVVRHVRGCVVLTRAWEAKLRQSELEARTDSTLAALPGHREVMALAQVAEALPQTVFASITAARDLAGGGAFPWEDHPSPRSQRARTEPGAPNQHSAKSGQAWSRVRWNGGVS